jgi:transcriptional regulator with XRE-family HTH domain
MNTDIFDKLGERIKFFRQRAGMKQMEMEMELDFSTGMISRIESDLVNPTKETVFKIANLLNLSKLEVDYLIGVIAHPATREEAEKAKEFTRNMFQKRGVLAYIVDDRSRIWGVSDSFAKLLQATPEIKEKVMGENMMRVVIDDTLGIRKFLDQESYADMIYHLLARSLYWEMAFMKDDYWYKRAMSYVKSDPIASEMWEKVNKDKPTEMAFLESRTVIFNFGGFKCKMVFSVEPIIYNERFRIVQYTPTNLVTRLIAKFYG